VPGGQSAGRCWPVWRTLFDGRACLRWVMATSDSHHAPEHGERYRQPAQDHHQKYQRRFHLELPL